MKRYIDLFTQQVKQNKILIFLKKAKKYGFILLGCLLGIGLLEAFGYLYLARQIRSGTDIKKKYNSFIIQNQVFDSKINYFAFKYSLLKQYRATDAKVSYYYGLLNTFLAMINSEGTITAFSIDNDQAVKFSLTFTTYQQASDFMSRLEDEKLPDYFQSLQLKEFTLSNQTVNLYILEFEGTFKKVSDAAST